MFLNMTDTSMANKKQGLAGGSKRAWGELKFPMTMIYHYHTHKKKKTSS